jgi:hypothetical protein
LSRESDVWNAESGVEVVDVPPVGNLRLRNQSGMFTIMRTPFASLEEYVEHYGDGPPALRKFILPAHEAVHAVSDLDAMGINYSHVYPGLEGYALAAISRFIIGS